ncbi:hypothetical protein FHR72_001421 [Mycolicibacterium iranicum]|uniref:Uncharacterized protein n=1 Tax=Mycolicibacterium iranicum TaxID=912594 RepID=A0A839Q0T5_MYCIR|nr:hypothetical protein [Mycolicibacterium iranicum]MBB2989958.1 hypothetical protein [Mycolicibacterium iranicum]
MPENFDVADRLAQGQPAVEVLQTYVHACRQLGYHHPDLTLHPAQLLDWYGTEQGMDLVALQRDCDSLQSAARSTQEALVVQERQVAQLSDAWSGAGGEAARLFLTRHGESSAAVAAAVRTAAEALATLRENLWRAVSTKSDAVVDIEGRTAASRTEWTAAAAAVTTGAGDRATASETVDRAVKPFVENAIGVDWLSAMRRAAADVTASYERAVAEMRAERSPVFAVPGDLGPAWTPPAGRDCGPESRDESRDEPRGGSAPCPAPAPPAATAPSAWAPPPAPPAPVSVAPAEAPPPPAPPAPAPVAQAEAPLPTAPAAPPMPGMGAMGGAMPDLGGGLSGLGQQFADTLGGLLGGSAPELPAPPELEEPVELAEPEPEEEPGPEEEEPEADDPPEEDEAPDEEPAEEVVLAEETPCEPAADAHAAQAAPTPPPPPPPAEPLPPAEPPAEPVAGEQTPCEIAADEVPQVGEPPE